ncbi:hypothetical protein [Streptomyces sp. NBC_00046]|uniref:hypothetical protein n=1 Tax=unclassified Streptomyces TaxID=2593676 RepID=UPI0032457D17
MSASEPRPAPLPAVSSELVGISSAGCVTPVYPHTATIRLVIVLLAVFALLMLGYDETTAIALCASGSLLAVEVHRRLS